MRIYKASWEFGYKQYIDYTKREALAMAKRDALKKKSDWLRFDNEYYERHGTRWYKY